MLLCDFDVLSLLYPNFKSSNLTQLYIDVTISNVITEILIVKKTINVITRIT